ncbi:hypothetical protein MPC4_450003 [Methylocella tundrae]|uniref:Uncharacterized protein n=1 Tax=Methylocella tundrae TaxID=227605 RepID=A0A8B6M9W0_METTU|nr:hypothetical protein MPC1_7010003 [Methylocella tundrae]VTZ51662.1 hypothetical protein MPC4_450003 [Methylocella tundrae]
MNFDEAASVSLASDMVIDMNGYGAVC